MGEIIHTKVWVISPITKLPEHEQVLTKNQETNREFVLGTYLLLMTYSTGKLIHIIIKHQLFTLQFFVESRRFVLSNWGSEAKKRPVSPLKARLWDILTDFSDWNWKVVWEVRRISWAVCSVLSVYWVARVCFSQMADRFLPRICTQQRAAKI